MMIKFTVRDKADVSILIAKKGCSLRNYAKEIGISNALLSQVLNKRRNPSPEMAKKIAGGIGKSIDDIFFVNCAHTESEKEGKTDAAH